MSVLGAIRPDSVNLPLFLHVLGAMVLTGLLIAVAAATLWGARTEGDATGLTRFGLKTMLVGVFPAYLLMRIGAQWTEAEENLPPEIEDQAWLGIGYITADVGALLVIVSMVLSAIGLRRLARGEGGEAQARAVAIISVILLALYLVAIWAMSAKPD